MGKDDAGAGVLLEAAALKYSSACLVWQQRHDSSDLPGGALHPAERDELARAVAEARAQLEQAARRFAGGPPWAGARCLTCGFQYGAHEGILIPCPLCEVKRLRERENIHTNIMNEGAQKIEELRERVRSERDTLFDALGWQGGTIHAALAEVRKLRAKTTVDWEASYERAGARLVELTRELEGLRAFKRSVDEALNSGDGSYRP